MHRLDSKLHGFYSPPLGWLALQSIVMSMSVHLFVCVYVSLCLSVRYYKTVRPNFSKFLSMLPVAMARSFSDGIAIRYVLPVCHIFIPLDQWAEIWYFCMDDRLSPSLA